MDQPSLFTPVPLVDPRQDPVRAPHQAGSHTSWTGSRVAVQTFGEKTSAILQLLHGGPKTRQELARLTGFTINAVCSVVGGLLARGVIERTGDYDTAIFERGQTKRERLRMKR